MKLRIVTIVWLAVFAAILPACNGDEVTEEAEDVSEEPEGEVSEEPEGEDSAVAEEEEEVTLRVVSSFPIDDFLMAGYVEWEQLIEQSDAGITIDYIGGEEVIPHDELGNSVRTGAVDVIVSAAYHGATVPEASAWTYSELSAVEEIERGTVDRMNSIHNEKLNAQVIGRMIAHQFNLYLIEEIESVEELSGARIRGSAPMVPFVDALGGELITMPPSEIYTAMERGLLEAFIWANIGVTDAGVHEQVNYYVDEPFASGSTVMYMNLDVWNDLSENQKDVIMQAAYDLAEMLPEIEEEHFLAEREVLDEAGVEAITLAEDVPELILDASWQFMADTVDDGAELEEYFRD